MIPIGKLQTSSGEFYELQLQDFENSGASSSASLDYQGYQLFMDILRGYRNEGDLVNRNAIHSFMTHYGNVTPMYLGYLNRDYSYLMIGENGLCYNILPSMHVGDSYMIKYAFNPIDYFFFKRLNLLYSLAAVPSEVEMGRLNFDNPYSGLELYESYYKFPAIGNPKDSNIPETYRYVYYANASGDISVKEVDYTMAWDDTGSKDFYMTHTAPVNSTREPRNYSIQIEAAASDAMIAQTVSLVNNAVKTVVDNISTYFVSR